MNHIVAVICLIAYLALPTMDVMNVPLASLTLHMIFGRLVSTCFLIGSVYMGFKSLGEDKIWPWRWNSLFLADWLFAICMSGLVFYFLSVWTGNSGRPFLSGLYGIGIALFVYSYYMFAGYVQEAGKKWQGLQALDSVQNLLGRDRDFALRNIAEYIDTFYRDKKKFPVGHHTLDIDWEVKHQFNFKKPSLINALF